jgi:hypothetical protein
VIWRWALSMVPWRTIMLHTPTIVKAARRYYGATRTASAHAERPAEGIEPVRRALEKQAALIDDLARQVQEMAAALMVLQARVRLALIGASLAVAVALVTAVLILWRHGP